MKQVAAQDEYKASRLVSKGQATVEFALVLVLMVAVLFGILEISRLLFMTAELENAAREAVRYASLHPGASLDTECLKNNAIAPKLTLVKPQDVTVDIYMEKGLGALYPVEVTLNYRWNSLVNIMPDMNTFTLKPLGPIDLRAVSKRFIEVPDARQACPVIAH